MSLDRLTDYTIFLKIITDTTKEYIVKTDVKPHAGIRPFTKIIIRDLNFLNFKSYV